MNNQKKLFNWVKRVNATHKYVVEFYQDEDEILIVVNDKHLHDPNEGWVTWSSEVKLDSDELFDFSRQLIKCVDALIQRLKDDLNITGDDDAKKG